MELLLVLGLPLLGSNPVQVCSHNELEGLHAMIESVLVEDGKLFFRYSIDRNHSWSLSRVGAINVVFCDENRKELGWDHCLFCVDENFVYLRVNQASQVCSVRVPKHAKSFTVEMGRSGLITRPLGIPPDRRTQ